MIDRIKYILEKIPVALILFLSLSYLAFDYNQFLNDPGSDLNLKKKEIADVRSMQTGLERKITDVKEFAKKIESVRQELASLASEFDSVRSVLPEKVNLAFSIKSVITEAQKLGLLITAIKPGVSEKKDLVSYYPFELEFQANYQQYLSLLNRIQELEEVIMVKDFQIESKGSKNSKYVELKGKVELFAVEYHGASLSSNSSSSGVSHAKDGSVVKNSMGGT